MMLNNGITFIRLVSVFLWLSSSTILLGCEGINDFLNLTQDPVTNDFCDPMLITDEFQQEVDCITCFPKIGQDCNSELQDWRNDLMAKAEYCIADLSGSSTLGEDVANCLEIVMTKAGKNILDGCKEDANGVIEFTEDLISCLNDDKDDD